MPDPIFTPEQVQNINAFQAAGFVHPFTCGNAHEEDRVLIATEHGLHCPNCDYIQGWVHWFMADGSMLENMKNQNIFKNPTDNG